MKADACDRHNIWANPLLPLAGGRGRERPPRFLRLSPYLWDGMIGWEVGGVVGAIQRCSVLSPARLGGLPQSPVHTAGLTAAQYGKNLMPPGTQPIWMLGLPLSQAQVVQKNCSGLILEVLQKAHSWDQCLQLSRRWHSLERGAFINGGTGLFPLKLRLLWGWRGGRVCVGGRFC